VAKLLFFDCETTGVMHWKNGIHQISGCIEIDGEVKEVFDYKVCPNEKCLIEDEALKVAGVTREHVLNYPHMTEVYNDIIKMLSRYANKYDKSDKFFLVGYNNASFDNNFFRAFFVQNDDVYFGSWFWSSSIDVMVLATHYLMNRRCKMTDFKLKTVAECFGIEINEARLHDAQYDIYLTREIYNIIRNTYAIQ
jgi:DNA polymerase III subunit epsilon